MDLLKVSIKLNPNSVAEDVTAIIKEKKYRNYFKSPI